MAHAVLVQNHDAGVIDHDAGVIDDEQLLLLMNFDMLGEDEVETMNQSANGPVLIMISGMTLNVRLI